MITTWTLVAITVASARHGLLRQLVPLGLSMTAAVVVYGAVAAACRCSELGELWTAFRKKDVEREVSSVKR